MSISACNPMDYDNDYMSSPDINEEFFTSLPPWSDRELDFIIDDFVANRVALTARSEDHYRPADRKRDCEYVPSGPVVNAFQSDPPGEIEYRCRPARGYKGPCGFEACWNFPTNYGGLIKYADTWPHIFCNCLKCDAIMTRKATPEEREVWLKTRAKWLSITAHNRVVVLREARERALLDEELKQLKPRMVVADALGLTNEEVEEWIDQASDTWAEDVRREVYRSNPALDPANE